MFDEIYRLIAKDDLSLDFYQTLGTDAISQSVEEIGASRHMERGTGGLGDWGTRRLGEKLSRRTINL
jgi:hypothetical protein